MLRKIAVPAVLVAGLVAGGASMAAAAPLPGPDTAACLEAQGVVKIRVAVAVHAAIGVDSLALTADQQKAVDEQQKKVDAAKVALDAALAKFKDAPTIANAAAEKVASDKVETELAALAALPGVNGLGVKTEALAKARAELQTAVDRQAVVCAPVVVPPTSTQAPTSSAAPTSTQTTAPAATTTAAAALYADCAAARDAGAAPINRGEPGYRAELDSDDDGIACEVAEDGPGTIVTTVPSGAVDTGWGA